LFYFSKEPELIFEYRNDNTGEIIERDFQFGTTPPSEIKHEGKKYRRIWTSMRVIYGSSFNTEGQVKFKRPPLEGPGFEYT
jgi:hypothetical protein